MDEPVRDVHGHVVWRVKVAPDEMTCCECGDTYPAAWGGCVRCSMNDQADRNDDGHRRLKRTRSVPTVSYLRADEFEMV